MVDVLIMKLGRIPRMVDSRPIGLSLHEYVEKIGLSRTLYYLCIPALFAINFQSTTSSTFRIPHPTHVPVKCVRDGSLLIKSFQNTSFTPSMYAD